MALATTTIVAIIGAAVAATGTYVSVQDSRRAAAKQQDAQKTQQAQQRQADLEAARQQVRQDRVKRATIIANAANTGVSASSGSLGAQSALGAQVANNVATISGNANARDSIQSDLGSAAAFQSNANTASAVAGVAAQGSSLFASTSSAQKDFNKLFGVTPATAG